MDRLRRNRGMFCVYFFGAKNFMWMDAGSVFPFDPDDKFTLSNSNKYLDRQFKQGTK